MEKDHKNSFNESYENVWVYMDNLFEEHKQIQVSNREYTQKFRISTQTLKRILEKLCFEKKIIRVVGRKSRVLYYTKLVDSNVISLDNTTEDKNNAVTSIISSISSLKEIINKLSSNLDIKEQENQQLRERLSILEQDKIKLEDEITTYRVNNYDLQIIQQEIDEIISNIMPETDTNCKKVLVDTKNYLVVERR
jgi:hypothetical protein